MKKTFLGMLAVSTAITAMPASATVINFDDLGNGVTVTNQYAGVTFSSISGSSILTTAQNLGSSLPNFICSGPGFINCVDDVYVDFASAVNGLSFVAVGDNNVGPNALVRVFGGVNLLGSVDIIGDGNGFTPYTVDLGAFSNITRIEIVRVTDAAGLGYDDFTFNVGGAVPEPSSWALMIAGFGLAGVALRRRRSVNVSFA